MNRQSTQDVITLMEDNKPEDWNVYKSLEAVEEVHRASRMSEMFPKAFRFRLKGGKYYESYSELRTQYLLERAKERDPAEESNKAVLYFRRTLNQIKSYFEGNEWILNLIYVIIDTLFCFSYLVEMQSNVEHSCSSYPCGSINLPPWLLVYRLPFSFHILVTISSIRLIFTLVGGSLFSAKNQWSYYFGNVYSLLSICICIPFLALSRVPDSRYIYVPYWLSIFPLLHNLKAWLIHKGAWTPFRMTEYREKIIVLVAYLIALIYTGMSLFNYFETRFKANQSVKGSANSDQDLSLVRTFYFMVITMSTVGYGDITPNTAPGQISIVAIILVALALLPVLVNDLYDTIKRQAQGAGSYGKYGNPFVVVCGDFQESWRILEFIDTLLRRSEKGKMTHVVLLARGDIPSELRYAIKHNKIRDRVFFFRGDALGAKCFSRVRLEYAEAAFILTKGRVTDDRLEDEANTLRAWAFDQYAPNTSIYLETRLPQTQYVLQDDSSLGVICVAEFKQIFLAYNCLYRGFSAVLLNLLRGKKARSHFEKPWECQYADGAENGVYRHPINPVFYRESFSKMALYLYRHFQIIAFAVDIYIAETDSFHLTLNPGLTYRLKPGDHCFFIAQSHEIVNRTLMMTKMEYERTKFPGTKVFRRFDLVTPSPSSMDRSKLTESSLPDGGKRRFSFVIGYPPTNADEKSPLCILNPTPAELESSIIDDAALMSDHFLEIMPILILCKRAPTPEEFVRLRYFPNIFFMIGDFRQGSVLRKAGLFRCSRVVLTNINPVKTMAQDDSFVFHDSTTIMLANLIEKMFRDNGIPNSPICEISLRTNIHLLGYSSRSFSKKKNDRLKLEKDSRTEYKIIDDGYFTPFYASGNVIAPVMLENLVSNSYHMPSTIKLFNAFSGVRFKADAEMDMSLNIQVSSLRYVAVPSDFVSKSFGSLFQGFSQVGVLPIGILRDNVGTELENPLPFVYTNPPWGLILKRTDLVYVLATQSATTRI